MTGTPDPYRKRWLLMMSMRVSGGLMLIAGLVLWQHGIGGMRNEAIGKALFLLGTFELFVLPLILRRLWRRGDGE